MNKKIDISIIIPVFNEENSLDKLYKEISTNISQKYSWELIFINDGSTDDTARVARQNGVDHIVQLTSNQGLARAFMTGLETCLQFGADVIVHTDADNQYNAADIPKLVATFLINDIVNESLFISEN